MNLMVGAWKGGYQDKFKCGELYLDILVMCVDFSGGICRFSQSLHM